MPTDRRHLVLLTEGYSEPVTAKTAVCLLRYRPEEVVAVYDSTQAGARVQDLLGIGGDLPVIGDLAEAPDADTLVIGIAPPGGRVPESWRPLLFQAVQRGLHLVSGLHHFLSDDEQLVQAAREHGVTIRDVRKNDERDVATAEGFRDDCFRVLTIGPDCSIGKMVAALEIARQLEQRGVDAKFMATGQTGILVEGDGCPIDCVVSDFVNGAVEKQLLAQQHHDVLVFEGQASIVHPRYSAVSAGLLHGARPHAMVIVWEPGRTHIYGMDHVPLVSIERLIQIYETMGSLMCPSKVVAIAMNGRRLTDEAARKEREKLRAETGLPVCDPIRDGAGEIVDALLDYRKSL